MTESTERPKHQNLAIIDYGSQYTQLIARRCRELKVHSRILPYTATVEDIAAMQPCGIILSGGPASVLDEGSPAVDRALFDLGCPVLGLCYGMQAGAKALGARLVRGQQREYGGAVLRLSPEGRLDPLFAGVDDGIRVWMSHGDSVTRDGTMVALGSSAGEAGRDRAVVGGAEGVNGSSAVEATGETAVRAGSVVDRRDGAGEDPGSAMLAAVRSADGVFRGLQFHPEVSHTEAGGRIIENFLYRVCSFSGDWRLGDVVEDSVAAVREQVAHGSVIIGLSGGVDSSVTAAICRRAMGPRAVAMFIDNGLLRRGEREEVEAAFEGTMRLTVVDAADQFLAALKGVVDPEAKRKAIGHTFIDVFRIRAEMIPDAVYLAQGTVYPDVIESAPPPGGGGASVTIKSHHNVGGLPEELGFELVEPLREFFKDEVRTIGRLLGLPETLIGRHPFPGPGLAVRIIGEVTRERLEVLRDADAIVVEEIRRAGLYDEVFQAFAVLLPPISVGVQGDGRTHESVVVIRSVDSRDAMTADWTRLPHDVIARMSSRLTNEVAGVNRVVFDVTSKPPGTIEWE